MDFAFLADHRLKIKENEKVNKYFDLTRGLRGMKKENCPLKGGCQIECVVYKVEVLKPSSNSNNRNDKKVYTGSMPDHFKQRYYNHKSSFANEIYRHKIIMGSQK